MLAALAVAAATATAPPPTTVTHCPQGYVAFANGAMCCPRGYDNDLQLIAYESTTCAGGRQCPCGGPYNDTRNGSGSVYDGCTNITADDATATCLQHECPSHHPFAYNSGTFCCATDPGDYDATQCADSEPCPVGLDLTDFPFAGACRDHPPTAPSTMATPLTYPLAIATTFAALAAGFA
jgi:hypothetical protein